MENKEQQETTSGKDPKLSLPTPVRTIENIPKELRKNYTLCQYCDGGFLTKDEENSKVFCSNCAYEDTIPVEETWDDIHLKYEQYVREFHYNRWIKNINDGVTPDSFHYWLKQHYLPPKSK